MGDQSRRSFIKSFLYLSILGIGSFCPHRFSRCGKNKGLGSDLKAINDRVGKVDTLSFEPAYMKLHRTGESTKREGVVRNSEEL